MYEQVSRRIAEKTEEYCRVWEAFCTIESPTACKEGVDAAGAYIAQLAQRQGWQVEYCRQQTAGDAICITMNAGSPGAPLAISGHIDTVHPVGSFGTPAVHRDENNIYGPGVLDCKGGIVAGLLAMDALAACGFDSRPICLLLQTDEEVGSRLSGKETIRWICEKAKDATAFINLEPHVHGWTCLVRKGIVSHRFTVTGQEAHSAMCATEGANAIADAAHRILALEAFKDADGITCNCGVIHGGTAVNTVPGSCVFDANFRFVTEEQFDYINAWVKELAAREYIPGCRCEVRQLSMRVAMELETRNLELLKKANAAFAKYGLPPLAWCSRTGGSDAADVTAFGVPCLDSVGVCGTGAHSVHESAELDSLVQAALRIAALACELQIADTAHSPCVE